MKKTINFYIISFLTLIFQFLFLSIIKEFENEFIFYIQIVTINQILISFLGSIQFYLSENTKKADLKINRFAILFLTIIVLILSIYYFYKDYKLFLFYLSSILSVFFLTLGTAYCSRFNKFFENTKILLFYASIKTIFVFFSYKYNFDVIFMIIFSNILVSIYNFKFVYNINLKVSKKNSFSLFSIFNNILGTSNTTLDKLYCSKFVLSIAGNYFLIFKVASIFQYFTEVIFRKERFIITEGKKEVNNSIINLKILILFLSIIFGNIFLKFWDEYILALFYDSYEFIYSFIEIIIIYIDEISIISISFLINSISGLDYDKIYRNFGNKKLFLVNLSNTFLFVTLLLIFGKTITSLTFIFLIIHIFNFFYVKILKYLLFKNV